MSRPRWPPWGAPPPIRANARHACSTYAAAGRPCPTIRGRPRRSAMPWSAGSGAFAILLLGHFRDAESLRALRSVPTTKPVKLLASLSAPRSLRRRSRPSPTSRGTRGPWSRPSGPGTSPKREFLLDVLGEIEPGPAMRTLADTALADEGQVAGGVPGGGAAPASPV